MKRLLLAVAVICFSASAYSQTTDYSLSQPGWTSGGDTGATQGPTYSHNGVGTSTVTGEQTIQAGPNTWKISPYTGSTMVGIQPGSPTASYNNMTTSLGLSSDASTALSGEIAAQNPSGGGNITNASWIYKNFTFANPTSFSMYWVYTSVDYVPFNDGSITTLVNTSSPTTLAKINGVSTQYILLGATNPGTGNYSTGSYGSTGWQVVNYEITTAGTYTLGFASFNQGDTALSPVLFVNDGIGTVTKNGEVFGAVAPNNPNMPTSPSVTPTTPTVVSTAPGPDIVTSSTSQGPSTSTTTSTRGDTSITSLVFAGPTKTFIEVLDTANRGKKFIEVTRTTTNTNVTPMRREDTALTPILFTTAVTTPYTTTTTTTPTTITNYSDGTSTTTAGSPVVTSTTQNVVTTSTNTVNEVIMIPTEWNDVAAKSNDQKQSASVNALNDSIVYNLNNPFLVSVIDQKDGGWANPYYSFTKANGSFQNVGLVAGAQKTFDNSSYGMAFRGTSTNNSSNYHNAYNDYDTFFVTGYAFTKQPWAWISAQVGYGNVNHTGAVSIPSFALTNQTKVNQNLYYSDVAVYAPTSFYKLRPFAGVTTAVSDIPSMNSFGSPLLATLPLNKTTHRVNPYAGVRYEYSNDIAIEGRLTQTRDYKTVAGVRAVAKKQISKNTYIDLTVGHDRGKNFNNTYFMVGLKISF